MSLRPELNRNLTSAVVAAVFTLGVFAAWTSVAQDKFLCMSALGDTTPSRQSWTISPESCSRIQWSVLASSV